MGLVNTSSNEEKAYLEGARRNYVGIRYGTWKFTCYRKTFFDM
jgi:hypothetical protein